MAPTTAPPRKVRRSAVPEYLPWSLFITVSPSSGSGRLRVYRYPVEMSNIDTSCSFAFSWRLYFSVFTVCSALLAIHLHQYGGANPRKGLANARGLALDRVLLRVISLCKQAGMFERLARRMP